jgi:Prenyltransferase and squalene oxidase repeat
MGVRLAAAVVAAAAAATPAAYLQGRQATDGGFSERGGSASPQLTAWAALGLKAAGASPGQALDYLVAHESQLTETTDVELVAVAESALGRRPEALLARIRKLQRPNGRIGPTINSTVWGILALRQARERAPRPAVRFVLGRQTRSGGWGWSGGGAPDSNDTAAAIQALRAAGVRGKPIRRGLSYLKRLQNRDGGFELSPGRGSDSQSTAWAIQAFVAGRKPVPRGSIAYLRRMRRADGSFRYSARYVTTPVWVTAQVLPALARRAFPLEL